MDPLEIERMRELHYEHSAADVDMREPDEQLEAVLEAASQLPALYCAWHPKVFGKELLMRPANHGHEHLPASHGICKDCEKWLNRKHYDDGRRDVQASNYEGYAYACGCGEMFVDKSGLQAHIAEQES